MQKKYYEDIAGNSERQNIEVVRLIIDKLGKYKDLIQFVKDRAGYDRRYTKEISQIKRELGWNLDDSFEEGIEETIDCIYKYLKGKGLYFRRAPRISLAKIWRTGK